jgi:hypothetical protein
LPGGFCTSWERGVHRDGQRLRFVFDAGVHDISGLGPNGSVRNIHPRCSERLPDGIGSR